jgi:hypothetical protein
VLKEKQARHNAEYAQELRRERAEEFHY